MEDNLKAAPKTARPQPKKAPSPPKVCKPPKALRSYKIAASDAPSRVDHCETLRTFTYQERPSGTQFPPPGSDSSLLTVDVGSDKFDNDTLFIWLPQFAPQNLMVLDVPLNAYTELKDFSNEGSVTEHILRVPTVPDMARFTDSNANSRCMCINAVCVLNTEFGNCNGMIKYKRYTEADSHRSAHGMLAELRQGTAGVYRQSLSQSDTIVMHAGVQNKNHLSQYSSHMSNHWGYSEGYPDDEAGLAPLSGWVFTFTSINASALMPKPVMHFASLVKVQRELTIDEAYLKDSSPTIEPETLSTCKRNEQPTQHFRNRAEDVRATAEAYSSLVGAGVATLTAVRAFRGGGR